MRITVNGSAIEVPDGNVGGRVSAGGSVRHG